VEPRFPKRSYGGVWNGKLLWGNLKHSRVLALLNNPSYAGAYVFGRFRSTKSLSTDGQIQSRIHEQPIDSWTVLIQDHHRAYISWQEYLENQQILLQNQTNKPEQLLAKSYTFDGRVARSRISLSIFLCPCPCGFAIPNRSSLKSEPWPPP
jgi:hypothetical protein